MEANNRLFALRELMLKNNIDAIIIPTADFHGSEYICAHFKAREYFSRFTGSAGTLLVLKDSAFLWTDGRYFLAAQKELSGSEIKLMKSALDGVPTLCEFLCDNLKAGSMVCTDTRLMSEKEFSSLFGALKERDISLTDTPFSLDEIWKDRPEIEFKSVFGLDLKYCGEKSEDKLQKVYDFLSENGYDEIILSLPEEIAWLVNLRGDDIKYTPVFLSFMVIENGKSYLFANEASFSEDLKKYLNSLNITLMPYFEFYEFLKTVGGRKIAADFGTAGRKIIECIEEKNEIFDISSPVALLKAQKTSIEYENMKTAHLYDAVACVKFIRYLKKAAKKNRVSEFEASEQFTRFRQEEKTFLQNSFEPIIAYGENGAIVHYSPDKEKSDIIKRRGFCLCDTGGHYLCGTTDITRTVALGHLTREEKRNYTLVLKANLALSMACFNESVYAGALDYLCRSVLLKDKKDYRHSTGHGVGYLLSVHESPPSISPKSRCTLCENMIFSNEPGLYLDGKYGIRLENLMGVKKAQESEYGKLFSLETLTLVPFERRAIDASLLSREEREFLNNYHKRVYNSLAPHLQRRERRFLKKETAHI